MVRTANGLPPDDQAGLAKVINSKSATCLNRVLNLETGSLAAEAALKMILARFHPAQSDSPEAKYKGRVPVVLVIGDDDGGVRGNYHGTTVLTQIMRGMWPGFAEGLEKSKLLLIRPVRPNKIEDVEAAIAKYEKPPYKIAGLFYELILMNYGAIRLRKAFVKRTHALCRKHDIPTVADEIQSCLWSPSLFMFREYGIKPTFLAVGKGIPGGEYSASRILFNAEMDSLPQFGALVTNGQEELASLAYLMTMRWAEANARSIPRRTNKKSRPDANNTTMTTVIVASRVTSARACSCAVESKSILMRPMRSPFSTMSRWKRLAPGGGSSDNVPTVREDRKFSMLKPTTKGFAIARFCISSTSGKSNVAMRFPL